MDNTKFDIFLRDGRVFNKVCENIKIKKPCQNSIFYTAGLGGFGGNRTPTVSTGNLSSIH